MTRALPEKESDEKRCETKGALWCLTHKQPLYNCPEQPPTHVALPLSVVEECEKAMESARAELTCEATNEDLGKKPDDRFLFGHWCTHCDEYADRNGKIRDALRSALSALKASR